MLTGNQLSGITAMLNMFVTCIPGGKIPMMMKVVLNGPGNFLKYQNHMLLQVHMSTL